MLHCHLLKLVHVLQNFVFQRRSYSAGTLLVTTLCQQPEQDKHLQTEIVYGDWSSARLTPLFSSLSFLWFLPPEML